MKSGRGYTLTELLVVVALVALAAAVALPSMAPRDDAELERVTAEFASAMRFARTEALRTGEPHGFRYLSTQKRIRVFSADTATNPAGLVWDVRHPVSKHLYDVTLPARLAGAPNPITRDAVYRGTCNTPGIVYFDGSGVPWCNDPANVLVDYFDLDFMVGQGTATVRVDGVTGRVTVQ